jgi:hypothetical protein
MNFSQALEEVKKGELLARSSWKDRGMFIFLVNGSQFKVNREPLLSIFEEGHDINYRPHIDMQTSDGSICVWTATQADIMSDDWEVFS